MSIFKEKEKRKPIFENFKNDCYNLICAIRGRYVFAMIELMEIMKQKDDKQITKLLNRFRTGSQTEHNINCINFRSISPLDDNKTIIHQMHCTFGQKMMLSMSTTTNNSNGYLHLCLY